MEREGHHLPVVRSGETKEVRLVARCDRLNKYCKLNVLKCV